MNQNTNLLAESPNVMWSFEKTTPFPATNGLYRSRVYTSNVNLNPLIAACDQLLSLVTTLKTTEYPDDCDKFLQDLAHEIRAFEHRAQMADYPSNIIIAARFAICCLLDETIVESTWGQKNKWSEKNLLSLFHNENYGGRRFFSIIDRALENISSNLHLIELLYLCLNFGFTGKYKELINGQNELAGITNKLYQIIGQYSSCNHKNILINDEKPQTQQDHVVPAADPLSTMIDHQKLSWIATIFAITISGLIFLGISIKLNNMSKPIYTALEQLSKNKDENQT